MAAGIVLSILVLVLVFVVERDVDSDGTGYVKTCAAIGLNLGVGRVFSTTYIRHADLEKVCGRDTIYDRSSQKCLPRDTPICDEIDLSTPEWQSFPSRLREGECQQNGCSYDKFEQRCDTRLECVNAVRKEWCDKNPNCMWLGGTTCRHRSTPEPVLRTGCGGGAEIVPASTLCGTGTHFHETRRTCERDENKL